VRRIVLIVVLIGAVAGVTAGWVWFRQAHVERIPAEYRPLLIAAAATCPGLRASVLAAQIAQESNWVANAVSSAGAQGIAQFMPHTWAAYGVDANHDGTANVFDPADAIAGAAKYDCILRSEVAAVPGDLTSNMLAAYNAGPGAVRRHHGIPPYPETQKYVSSILARAARSPYVNLG